jgi:hypothetical protein
MRWPWQTEEPALDQILSLERIERYLVAANNNRRKAYKLYALNTAVSECLYVSMQMLEISLRNRFNACLADEFGDDWYDAPGVITTLHHRTSIKDAKLNLIIDKKHIEPSRLVASLTFGFWTACLGNNYEEKLWRPALHKAFPSKPKTIQRRAINNLLSPLRSLRNRTAHHEPILYWDLPKHYETILTLTGWLSPPARDWTERHCRFRATYTKRLASLFRR